MEISKLHVEINKQIQEKISGQQREFFLKEQLKAIKKELGLEKEGKTTEIEKFQERLKDLTLNAEAKKAVEDEIGQVSIARTALSRIYRFAQLSGLAHGFAVGKIQPGFL